MTAMRAQLVMVLATLALAALAGPRAALAAGVVGTGSAASCTDGALNTALAGGGLVTFNCGGGLVTIDISTGTGIKTIGAATTIDGGSLITISGGNSVGVFSVVNTGVKFTVQNLTIANGIGDSGGGFGGGIINITGTVTVINCTFSGNSAYSGGGGIENWGTLTVTNSTFSGNRALRAAEIRKRDPDAFTIDVARAIVRQCQAAGRLCRLGTVRQHVSKSGR
jgi:hypothetical protein